jgi:hypothetical protein
MGSAEERVNSEVQWMKSEFNLDAEKEQRLHDVLLKYEKQGTTTDKKMEQEKEREIKSIIGDENYKIYKQRQDEMNKGKSGSSSSTKSGSSSSTKSGTTSGSSTQKKR